MLVIKLLRYFYGFISFRAEKGFPERFVNLCRRYGIELWELKCRDGILTACTDCRNYKKIRAVAKRSGMKVRLTGKFGLPFFVGRHSFRIGVPIGLLTGLAVLLILSSRIWSIEVSGNVNVPNEQIIAVFEQVGVHKGASTDKIKSSAAEIEASKLLPQLSWININVDGCKAYIEVRETVEKPETEEKEGYCNIVASRDGTIVSIRPFSGTQEQKTGGAVLKGDLLISGIKENKDLSSSFCRAAGYVVAQTERTVSIKEEQKIEAVFGAEKSRGYVLHFLSFRLPLGKATGYAEETHLRINGVDLPLGLVCIRENIYEKRNVTLSKSRSETLAWARFLENCADSFRGCEVKTIKAEHKNGEIKGEFVCLENIAKEQDFEIETENSGNND